MTMSVFWDYVSVSVVGLYTYPILKCIEEQSLDLKWIICLIGLFMMHIVTTVIKRLVHKPLTDYTNHWSHRPDGATNCDILCRNGDQQGRPGFPSGHMATVAFFTIYWLIVHGMHRDAQVVHVIFIIYTILVALSRHRKKCHTLLQICVGYGVGATSAVLMSFLT
jgi:membrane-associated phospholipid phosphatase